MDLKAERERRQDLAGAEDLRRERELLAVRWLMSEPHGRLILWDLLELAGVRVLVADCGAVGAGEIVQFSPNAMTMAYESGRKGVVHRLQELARRNCPAQWELMVTENRA